MHSCLSGNTREETDAIVHPTPVCTRSSEAIEDALSDSHMPAHHDDNDMTQYLELMPVDNLTSRDSNSPVENSTENHDVVDPEAENKPTHACTQQHTIERINHSKEKKRRGEHIPTLSHDLERDI